MGMDRRRLTMEESRRVARRVDEFRVAKDEFEVYLKHWRKIHNVTTIEEAAFLSGAATAALGMPVYYERADRSEK